VLGGRVRGLGAAACACTRTGAAADHEPHARAAADEADHAPPRLELVVVGLGPLVRARACNERAIRANLRRVSGLAACA